MRQPAPVFWFRVLCVWVALVNVGLVLWGWWLWRFQPGPEMEIASDQMAVLRLGGITLIGLGVVFAPLNLWIAFARPSSWFWTVAATNIVAGGFCCPLGWLLLLVWFQPSVKRYFEQSQ